MSTVNSKNMKSLVRILAVLGIIGCHLFLVTMIFATEPPSATPTITNIKANVDLRQTGDVLIYGEYKIPYTAPPGESADRTYTFRLIGTDNTTQLGAILPFVRFDNGYNDGGFSFYFTTADNLTTDQAYTIRISQNPAYFDEPESWDYVMPLSAWTSATSQEDNQVELTLNIISMAQRLEAAYSDDLLELLESSAGGTVLSSPAGETYFRGVIYGLQTMAPDLFLVQVFDFETGDRLWGTDEFDAYQERWGAEWMATTTENTSATFGLTTPTLMSVIFGLPIILGAVVISAIKFKRIEPAYLVAALVLILLALMGWMSIALFALIFQLMAIYIGYLWFYARKAMSWDLSFLAFVWFTSTLICIVIEGGDFTLAATSVGGGTIAGPGTIINDLAAIQGLSLSNLIGIPTAVLSFARGLFRMLIWDYSFYSGNYVIIRWFWMATLSSAAVWGIFTNLVHALPLPRFG